MDKNVYKSKNWETSKPKIEIHNEDQGVQVLNYYILRKFSV